MFRFRWVFAALLLLVILSACRQPPPALERPVAAATPFTTDREHYTPRVRGGVLVYTLQVSYTNRTGSSVYLLPCGFDAPAYDVGRLEEGQWADGFYGLACPAVFAPALEVPPGGRFATTLTLQASSDPSGPFRFGTGLATGVYRFAFQARTRVTKGGAADLGALLPLEARVSNAFELRAP